MKAVEAEAKGSQREPDEGGEGNGPEGTTSRQKRRREGKGAGALSPKTNFAQAVKLVVFKRNRKDKDQN